MTAYNGIQNILFGNPINITSYIAISPTTTYIGQKNLTLKDLYSPDNDNVIYIPPTPQIKQVGQMYISIKGKTRYDSI